MSTKKKNDKNIKDYETLYTTFFVILFMILFGVIGYYSLGVQNKNILSSIQINKKEEGILFYTSSVITIESEKKNTTLSIENLQDKDVNIQVYFKEDERMKRECGCSYSGFHYSSIRYSMEGAHNLSFQDGNMVVLQDTILSKEKKDINITMWLEGQDNTDAHIHGTFVVKEV